MINCELFSHVYFALPPIPRSCTYLDSLGKFDFHGLSRASKINVDLGPNLGFEMKPVYNSGLFHCLEKR